MSDIEFEISIGDWSGDGHGKHEDFTCTSNKPIEAVREAYFKAKKALPEAICPENFCDRYGEGHIPYETWLLIQEHFPDLSEDEIGVYDRAVPTSPKIPETEWMAKYVALFIMKGDADLQVTVLPDKDLPTLAFFGCDKKKRHIGFIGYGLLS